ncbi:MAG: type II secretion system protein [Fimbriimonas sp.]
MKTKGFTLVEVLVVMSIIALLALVTFPVFRQSVSQAKNTNCLSNVRQLVVAQLLYYEDWQAFSGEPSGSPATVKRLGGVLFECPAAEVSWRKTNSYVNLMMPMDADPAPGETKRQAEKYASDVLECFEKRAGSFPVVLDQNHATEKETYRGSGSQFVLVGRQSGTVERVPKARIDDVYAGRNVPCDPSVILYNF